MRLDLSGDSSLSLKTGGMEAPNLCSFALVAGKYLDHLDEVLRKVDELAESTDNIPIAVYLFREYNNQELKINNSLR